MVTALRVFIAEDEAIILRNFTSIVEKMGHQVVGFALNGIDAAQMIFDLKPDLVLIDINMPGKDGLTVIRECCAKQMIPTIVITGHFSDEIMDRVNHECVFGYLMKPVDNRQLDAAINVAWNRYEQYLSTTNEARHLQAQLENRKLIERAKGILMDDFGLKESESMARLQKMSKDRNKKLHVVAKDIIDAKQLFHI